MKRRNAKNSTKKFNKLPSVSHNGQRLRGKARKILSLPTDAALVLQQVLVNGSAELVNLSETLNISRNRLAHIVSGLKSKGLIKVTQEHGDDALFVKISNRGRRLAFEIWPEAAMAAT